MKNITNLDIKRQNLGLSDALNSYDILFLYKKSSAKKKFEIISVIEVLKFNEKKYSEALNLIFKLEKVNSVEELSKKISKADIEIKNFQNASKRKILKNNKTKKTSESDKFFESFAKNKFYIFSGIVVFIIILSIAIPEKTTSIQSDKKVVKTNNIINLSTENGQKYINASINGNSKKFLLDTGASDILIPQTYLNQLRRSGYLSRNIHFKFNKNYMTASGDLVQAEVWNVPMLQVGKFKIYNVEVASMDDGSYLFGMSAIEKLGKVSIDLESSRIVIDK
tara:strand:- start:2435 stop:3274 length:840 start_codon:yes stop_codon:yes gene_type:complete